MNHALMAHEPDQRAIRHLKTIYIKWSDRKIQKTQRFHMPGELLFMKSQLFTEVLLLTLTRSPLVFTETPSVPTERPWGLGGWGVGFGQGLEPNFIPSYRL